MYVVYEAPLGMLADYPEAYEGQPEFQFIEKVPTVWDETRVLNGEPAQYVTIARQHGDDWYIGGITNWDERNLAVPLDFLGQDEYEALIFADGPDANKVAGRVTIDKKRMRRSDKLNLHMASGGGFAVILTPAAR